MRGLLLSEFEVAQLTKKVRFSAQARALNAMGIEHKHRPDGSIAVLRSHVEKELGGAPNSVAPQEEQPNWGAL